uniref:putative transferase CAF17 homolog, mitochondrial n=1 Tax=Styela clava TaxID=7725 RepID=UPI00193A2B7C|nr:putative transferase CAF17 homolog, mitochondrial [Styela clava]
MSLAMSRVTLLRRIFPRFCSKSKMLSSARHMHIVDKDQDNVRYAHLKHRSLLELEGRDVTNFLQGIITNDVELLPEMKCMYAMILNQHGRIMHDIMLYHQQHDTENKVLLECESSNSESIIKILKLYKLRKKLSITPRDNLSVVQAMSGNSFHISPQFSNVITSAIDPRVPMLGHRLVVENMSESDSALINMDINAYHHKRHYIGVPEGPLDLPPGTCLPLECNLDFMNGVSFHKGCYIGQELTARTKFTGVIRKRLVPVSIEGEGSIESGSSIYTEKRKSAGKFRSMHSDGKVGLALVRLNYSGETLSSKDGQLKFRCHIPMWWPSEDGTEFSDGVCGPAAEENI